MKHLMEFLEDNDCALNEEQELLIMEWLSNSTHTGKDLGEGMRNHIKDRLYTKHLKERNK